MELHCPGDTPIQLLGHPSPSPPNPLCSVAIVPHGDPRLQSLREDLAFVESRHVDGWRRGQGRHSIALARHRGRHGLVHVVHPCLILIAKGQQQPLALLAPVAEPDPNHLEG